MTNHDELVREVRQALNDLFDERPGRIAIESNLTRMSSVIATAMEDCPNIAIDVDDDTEIVFCKTTTMLPSGIGDMKTVPFIVLHRRKKNEENGSVFSESVFAGCKFDENTRFFLGTAQRAIDVMGWELLYSNEREFQGIWNDSVLPKIRHSTMGFFCLRVTEESVNVWMEIGASLRGESRVFVFRAEEHPSLPVNVGGNSFVNCVETCEYDCRAAIRKAIYQLSES